MRKTISLLVLLLMMVAGANSVSAQTDKGVKPLASASDGSTDYQYYLYNVENNSFFVSKEENSRVVMLGNFNDGSLATNGLKVKLLERPDGSYQIVQKNIDNYSSCPVIVALDAAEGKKLSYTTTIIGSIYNVKAWSLQTASASTDDDICYNIVASSNNAYGWKTDASNNCVILSQISSSNGFTWRFVPANQAAENMANAEFVEAYQNAQDLLDKVGVGYPKEDAASRTTLKNAMTASDATASSINAAITTYKSSTDDIQMPEDGKVYKIYAHFPNDKEEALYWDGGENSIDATATPGASSYFFCHEVNGKYLFVNKDGKYLNWFPNNTGEDATKSYSCEGTGTSARASGATDSYDETANLWEIARADISNLDNADGYKMADGNDDFFGLVQMKGKGKEKNSSTQTTYFLLVRYSSDNGRNRDFISAETDYKCYDSNWNGDEKYRTFAFHFEEVDCTPLVLHSSEYGNIGTYSTPFPVTLPTGMTAYYGEAYNGGSVVRITSIDDESVVLPENVGFVIIGEEEGSFTPVPAAVAAGKDVTSALTPTNGDDVPVPLTQTAYILGQIDSKTAFYKLSDDDRTIAAFRAYLNVPTSASSIQLDFSATGIGSAVSTLDENANAPVFDLSGRRVSKPAHGVYIKNGKKFIVK